MATHYKYVCRKCQKEHLQPVLQHAAADTPTSSCCGSRKDMAFMGVVTPPARLQILRTVGFCAYGFNFLAAVQIGLAVSFVVAVHFMEPGPWGVLSALLVVALVTHYFIPALFGFLHFRSVRKRYGKEVRNDLFQRFAALSDGQNPNFSLEQVVAEHEKAADTKPAN